MSKELKRFDRWIKKHLWYYPLTLGSAPVEFKYQGKVVVKFRVKDETFYYRKYFILLDGWNYLRKQTFLGIYETLNFRAKK